MSEAAAPRSSYESPLRAGTVHVGLVTDAPAGSRRGNRITAERWQAILRGLGHACEIFDRYDSEPFDILVALHAARGSGSVARFREQFPTRPALVAVTGTDVYGDEFDPAFVRRSLTAASRIIVLQPRTADDLEADLRPKVRVIFQSADPPVRREPPHAGVFEVAVVGHLRPVKDPFRAAEAARQLPADSAVRILHLGGAMSPDMADRARHEAATNPRYRWLGDLSHDDALAVMARCRVVALTSLSEGGPAVIAEAIVAGVPVIASRVPGCVGMLGDDYPGLFAPGDTAGLAALFSRAERDRAFYAALRTSCDHRRPLFEPAAERAAWRDLLAELGVGWASPPA